MTDCKVVLSSSWKHSEESSNYISQRVVSIYDVTPEGDSWVRGEEIKMWLEKHPEVKVYAILDDDSDMLPDQIPNFFQTSWKTGLTEDIAAKVIHHLNKVIH